MSAKSTGPGRRSLSDVDRSTAANDLRPSASFSARKSPHRIPANTPPVFPGLRPRIWPHLLRLVANGNVGQVSCQHYSLSLLLQPTIRRCDKPDDGRARRSVGQHTGLSMRAFSVPVSCGVSAVSSRTPANNAGLQPEIERLLA